MTTGRLPSVEGGIQPTIVDAKGDLIVATAADTVSRIAVGANDTVLTADSSTATGLKWATPSAGGLTLISTTTLSGTSVTLSSIPQTYNNLLIVLSNVSFDTGTSRMWFIPNNSTDYAGVSSIGGPSITATTLSVSNRIETGQNWNQANNNNVFTLNIYNYTSSTAYKSVSGFGYANSSAGQMGFSIGGSWRNRDAITSLVIKTGDNYTMTAGEVLLYGVK